MAAHEATVRVGEYIFESSTGEVRGAGDEGHSVRLPPKPSALLDLLIEARGQVVSHDQIRAALWPDVHVDYDQNVRFCVRQVRAAFGDAASEPRYVGTVPKRGYRLLAEVREVAAATRSGARRRGVFVLAVVLATVLLLGLALGLASRGADPPTADRPVRLALVPFELAGDGGRRDDLARLGEWLLAELVAGRTEVLEVVGPRTTAPYAAFPFPDLRALGSELDIDFVLNARPLVRDGERQLLVELIRLSDGSHPFARFYEDRRPWREIGAEVSAEVLRALDLPASTTELESEVSP